MLEAATMGGLGTSTLHVPHQNLNAAVASKDTYLTHTTNASPQQKHSRSQNDDIHPVAAVDEGPTSPPAAPATPAPSESTSHMSYSAQPRALFTPSTSSQPTEQRCRVITLHRTSRHTTGGTVLSCSVTPHSSDTRGYVDDDGGSNSNDATQAERQALAYGMHGAVQQRDEVLVGVVADPVIMPEEEAREPLLCDGDERFCLYPLRFPELFEFYKKSVASFWPVEEVDLGTDVRDWLQLSDDERHFLKYVLAFFASSDGIVMENLAVRFMAEVTAPEARAFYGFQIAMENVHSEMYSLLLDTYIRDKDEKHRLFRAVDNFPCIARKANWAKRWISDPQRSFAERLVAFACVEGIHFSGSFCAIYWLKQRGPIMPGLTFSNELISRDEGLHTDFACALYVHLRNKLPAMVVYEIVSEAVALEEEFCTQALSVRLIGMSAEGMKQYIQFVADRLLVALGYEKLYTVNNPFPWMDMISLQGKSNFFERRVGEYQRANVMSSRQEDGGRPFGEHVFTLDADF